MDIPTLLAVRKLLLKQKEYTRNKALTAPDVPKAITQGTADILDVVFDTIINDLDELISKETK